MYNSYLIKVTSVFTRQRASIKINSLGLYSCPGSSVAVKPWSRASNQNHRCPDHMFLPLYDITCDLTSHGPLPFLCSHHDVPGRWSNLQNAVEKTKGGPHGLPEIREHFDTM